MSIVEVHSKKRITDIKPSENSIDVEYINRLRKLKSISEFKDLIRDYEEFLPFGLCKYAEELDDIGFKKLQRNIERVFNRIKNRQPMPAEPTIELLVIMPQMLTMVRALAFTKTKDKMQKQKCGNPIDLRNVVTWGQAFHDLSSEGRLESLIRMQENTYQQAINSKEMVAEMIDTES